MELALEQARLGLEEGEVPVGCVFVQNGEILVSAHNETNLTKNATKHCEIVCIDKLGAALHHSELYVTCEPCIMCAEALNLIRVSRVYFGCFNEKFGGNGSVLSLNS